MQQIEEKDILKGYESQRDAYWYEQLVQQLKVADTKEEKAAVKVQEANARMAKDQKVQLEAYKESYKQQLRDEKTQGEAVKQKALRDIKEEEDAERTRRVRAKQANEGMFFLNQIQ